MYNVFKMKQMIQNFFREFDLFFAPAGLRIKGSPTLKSCFLGFLSVLIFAGLIYILVFNWISIVNYNQITFQMAQTIIPAEQASGEIKMFGLFATWILNATWFGFNFDFHLNYYVDGKLQQRYCMQLCQPEQWKDIGPDYQQLFYKRRLNSFFCPNNTTPFKLQRTLSQQNPTYISLTMDVCDPLSRQDCTHQQLDNKISDLAYTRLLLYFLDTGVNPTIINSTFYFMNYHMDVFTPNIKSDVQLLFTTFTIQTDMSIWPFQTTQIIQGASFNTATNIASAQYNTSISQKITLSQFRLSMNKKIKKYTRSIGKVDGIISYVGGLFSIGFPVLIWFFINYNKYRFEITVAEGAFNIQNRRILKASDFNFWTYIKYTIYSWLNLIFCCRLKWKNCNKIQDVREEINKQMDVRNLFLRLQATQRAIHLKIQDNEEDCINLLEPYSLNQVRKQRLKLDYYDEVVKQNQVITLQDLLKKKSNKEQQNHIFYSMNSAQFASIEYLQEFQNINKQSFQEKIKNIAKTYKMAENSPKFIQTKQLSQKVLLCPQFIEIQDQMVDSYKNLDDHVKQKLECQVPMIILHRLNAKIIQKRNKQSNQQNLIQLNQKYKGNDERKHRHD